MRLFLWLAAVLAATFCSEEKHVIRWNLTKGFPDGSIITFFVWHTIKDLPSCHNHNKFGPCMDPVMINFYTGTDDDIDQGQDIPAQLLLEKTCHFPVVSTVFLEGKWTEKIKEKQHHSFLAVHEGWWRVDVYKNNNNTLNVFFNGFWSGSRTFEKSLDHVTQIYIRSDFVDSTRVHMYQKDPNNAVIPIASFDYENQIACRNATNENMKCGQSAENSKMAIVALLLLPILILANEPPPPAQTTVTIDPNTVLVLFGTRHGNRNPEKFVTTPERKWGQEGELELTSIGKRQAYGLGKEVRSFIGKFIDGNYKPSEGKFYSSSANRCQMTLQSALAGVFDPTEWADWNKEKLDHWSPVPYSIDDPLLRMYSVKGCVKSDDAWEPISKDTLSDLKVLVAKNKKLLNYMKQKDGREPTISNAADIADNIINMDFYNATYPDWLARPTLSGYTATTIKKAFLAFAENHMNRCASFKPCRDMMGGLWANHIISSLEAAVNGTAKTKLIGYASHTEVTLSTMILLGIDKSELTTSAGFVIELRNNTRPAHVRVMQHDPNPIDAHVIYPAHLVSDLSSKTDANGWMPLTALKEYISRASFSNWELQCGIDKCKV